MAVNILTNDSSGNLSWLAVSGSTFNLSGKKALTASFDTDDVYWSAPVPIPGGFLAWALPQRVLSCESSTDALSWIHPGLYSWTL